MFQTAPSRKVIIGCLLNEASAKIDIALADQGEDKCPNDGAIEVSGDNYE